MEEGKREKKETIEGIEETKCIDTVGGKLSRRNV